MTDRVWNFSAGPATLPQPVLERIREELPALPDAGASVLEISHRSGTFDRILEAAEADLRAFLGIPRSHHVLFLQGGASLQFAMVPMNLTAGGRAAYVVTGSWGEKALAEARIQGAAEAVWSGAADGYRSVPDLGALERAADAPYLHVTSNETIQGVELPDRFEAALAGGDPGGPPLVCDASSDFLARPIAVERFGLLYAGAQKNAGPAGVTVAILRQDVLDRIPDGLPTMLDYRTHVEHGSRYHTPPVFAIYALGLVVRWVLDEIGGIEKMHERNLEKASLLYEAIDASEGFYEGHAEPGARSIVNVTFRLPSTELERAFLAEASRAGLVELAGHRSIGGIRASIYNAMPLEGVRTLRELMDAFRAGHA